MTATDPQSSSLPRGAIACLSLAAFGSGVSLRVNDALLPKLATEFGVGLGQAAQVISMFAIAYGLAQLLFGPLGDRFGKYRVIAWASIGCAITTAVCASAQDFDQLRIARVLAGATAAAIIPLSMAWIGDVIDYKDRQPVLARFLIGQILGLAAGVTLGGIAADHWNWRIPYVLLSILFLTVSIALFALHRRLPERARVMRIAQGSAALRMVSDFAHVLAVPWARAVLLTVFLEGMFLYGPFAFIASHLHQRFEMTLSSAGAIVMLFGAGGFVFALGSAKLVKRLGEVGLLRTGGALVGLTLLVLAFTPLWWIAVPASLLLGLGFYMLHNTLQVNATQMAPERRGAAVAAFASCFFLGQSLGVGLCGWLVDDFGAWKLLALGGLGVVVVAANFAILLTRHQRAQPVTAN